MHVLVDTGILLRIDERSDPLHFEARSILRRMRSQGHVLVAMTQSIAEFWNVCTRPKTARGGFGLSTTATKKKLRLIERMVDVYPESPLAYAIWKRLVEAHNVQGVQVHDARLVAAMISYGIKHVTTFNAADFVRYPEVAAIDARTAI